MKRKKKNVLEMREKKNVLKKRNEREEECAKEIESKERNE